MRTDPLYTGSRARSQRGFTLIESMVALLVLSIGLIGIAALHGQGLAASRTAVYRTHAINLSADMADRIRANRIAGTAYNNASADNGCFSGGTDCTPEELAEHDLDVWAARIAEELPGPGTGTVEADDSTDPITYTITVQWDEVGQADPLQHVTEIEVPEF